MAKDALDAYIELTPSKKMRLIVRRRIAGTPSRAIAPSPRSKSDVSLRHAQSLAKAKALRDRDKLDEDKQEELEEKEEDGEVRIARERPSVRTGDTSKRLSLPNHEGSRTQFAVSDAGVFQQLLQAEAEGIQQLLRSEGDGPKNWGTAPKPPSRFLEITFRGVYIVGYEFETQGTNAAEETVEFCFQTCEMKYISQAMTGEMALRQQQHQGLGFQGPTRNRPPTSRLTESIGAHGTFQGRQTR